jgi:hypothetical protein
MPARLQHLALGHEPAVDKVRQHDIGARARCRQVDVWSVFARSLEQAGHHGCLRKGEVAHALAEIEIGCGFDAEGAAAHIGAVEVKLQYLFLGQVRFQPQREEGFLDLAFQRALVGQEQVLGELLGEAGTALNHGIGADIFGHGAHEAENIDAVMVEEAAILRCKNRLDDMIGHLVDRHRIALDEAALADFVAVAVEEGDSEIVLRAPVPGRFLEGRHGQRQHDHRTACTQGEAFAQQLNGTAPPAFDTETAKEDGRRFPELTEFEAGLIESRIEPGVDCQQESGDTTTFLLRLQGTDHLQAARLQ